MVEGHSVHRVAAAHRARLVGKSFTATSPNGRFADGASAINGKPFQRIEAVGKNLFAFFGSPKGPLAVVHIHFGMAGVWAVFDSTRETVPPTTGTTRLCLEHAESGLVSHLSAMTVQLGDEEFYRQKKAGLGQDPLREDADAELLFEKVSKSAKKIGELLMDQSFFCGPGNIYRAEILFKAGVHPNIPGRELGRERFNLVWHHTVELLRRGFECGSILTVDEDEAKTLGKPTLRRYIYNSANCGRCGSRVQSWDMAGRTCYACSSCQPAGADAAEAKDARDAEVFVSHCAKEPLRDRLAQGAHKLVVRELHSELLARGLSTAGKKPELVQRLQGALQLDVAAGVAGKGVGKAMEMPASVNMKLEYREEYNTIQPRVSMKLDAAQAAAEKAHAGESRAVEHIAELHPVQAAAAAGKSAPRKAAGGRRAGAKAGAQGQEFVGQAVHKGDTAVTSVGVVGAVGRKRKAPAGGASGVGVKEDELGVGEAGIAAALGARQVRSRGVVRRKGAGD